MNVETLAYAAGLMDGEGCIHVCLLRPSKANRRTTPRYDLFLKIPNTYLPVLEWLKSSFGGAIVNHHSSNENRVGETWRAAWTWQCSGRTAQACLQQVLPYLKIKRQQAILAIEFQDFNQSFLSYSHANRNQEVIDRRESYRQQINSMTRTKQPWISDIMDITINAAYTAGFFDGEGSIMVLTEKGAKHRLRIKISNTDHAIVQWIQSIFGGFINDNLSTTRKRRPNESPAWEWRLNGSEAAQFLKIIQPFLRIKHEQARLANEFQEYAQTLPYGFNRIEGAFERCEAYRIQISNLNGHPRSTLLSAD